mmetsp:Transcript_29072/g.49920  ORF Transcript_29072/g.49920 Transcript_29072/m.49920 type:complete len:111 (+) Transcript_29072:1749-2081(+)
MELATTTDATPTTDTARSTPVTTTSVLTFSPSVSSNTSRKDLDNKLTHQVITAPAFTYTGTTLKGSRHGYGIFEYIYGVAYAGEWRNNKQHARSGSDNLCKLWLFRRYFL